MIEIPNPMLPTLSAAMALSGPRGMCFHRSMALCLDLEGSFLVIGTLRAATKKELLENPERSKVRFYHAWVEYEGLLLSPTTIEEAKGLPLIRPKDYYEVNKVHNPRYLPHSMVKDIADPPILAHLKLGHRLSTGYLVNRLFQVAGLEYRLSEQGGVIP